MPRDSRSRSRSRRGVGDRQGGDRRAHTQPPGGERGRSWTAWAPLTNVTAVASWPFEMKRTIGWYTAISHDITGNMIPKGPKGPKEQDCKALSQHFELADILHAIVKGSDLSVHVSEMNVFFWIFIVALVFTIFSIVVRLTKGIKEVLLDGVVAHCGETMVYLAVIASLVTWLAFISYFVQVFLVGARATELQQRTVQFHGTLEQLEPLRSFCREIKSRKPEITWDAVPSGADCCLFEVVFPTLADMHDAFTSDTLAHTVRISTGDYVFCRPKMGKNAAVVELLLICFANLKDNVPNKFWLRAALSCLVTIAVMSHLVTFVVSQIANLLALSGWPGTVLSTVLAYVVVVYLIVFVGFHGCREIWWAMEEMKKQDLAAHRSAPTP